MKNNQNYTSFEKYQMNPPIRNLTNKIINSNTINDNLSFEVQKNFNKKGLGPYSSIEADLSKNNLKKYQFNDNNFAPDYNKDYYYKVYYAMKTYQPEEYITYTDFNYSNNWNDRPSALYSQSIDYKTNNLSNCEDNIHPANHSYYESKYSKKKTNEIKLTSNNINIDNNDSKYVNNLNQNYNDKNNENILSLNKNLNKNIIMIKNNNRFVLNHSPLNKKPNESYFHKIQKNTINIANKPTSENKKKNIIFNCIINNKEINSNNTYNNINTKSIIQPRTPSIDSHNVINSPLKNEEKSFDINYQFKNETNYNKNDKNIPSKSSKNISFKKLIFPQIKNRITIKTSKKIDISQDNKINETDSSKLSIKEKITNTPKEMKVKGFTKFYNNKDNNNFNINNNMTINIKDINDKKNYIANIKLNNNILKHSTKEENINNNIEMISSQSNKRKEDNLNQIDKKKKSSIQSIKIIKLNKSKILNSPVINKRKNIIFTKTNEKDKNIDGKNTSNIIIKSRDFEDEKNYLKEVEDIMYEQFNTEPSSKIRNNFKYNKNINNFENKDNNHKVLNIKNISKGRDFSNKEIVENNNQAPKIPSVIGFKRYNKSGNYELKVNQNKDNDNQICRTISNLTTFEHNNRIKINDFATIKNSINISNINNIKKNKSNKTIETIKNISKTESKNISKNDNKGNLKTISIKKLNQMDKKSNLDKHLNSERLTIRSRPKIPNKTHKSLNELPKHENSFNIKDKYKIMKKNIVTKEDEWDKIEYKGMRKKTYEPGRRSGKATKIDEKNNSLKSQFSSTLYIKASEALCLAGKNEYGNKKTNQDTYVIERNVNGVLNFNIFGVLDGHGDNGHFASQFVSRYVIYKIKNHPLIKKLDEPKEIYRQFISKGYEIIANIFLDADSQIRKEKFDVRRSGTTIVLVIQLEEHIICANTGDSRAIAIYDEQYEDNLVNSKVFPLSYDCKPELPNEKKRINQFGGVVEKAYSEDDDDDYLPYRVWAKDENYPGLAMSRSIGDTDAKKLGVIANPQVIEYTIDYFSKYILIGSDGIWEFISNEEAMKIANKYYLRNDTIGLCHELSKKATKLWEEKDVVIDDITILVVFF